MVSYGPGSVNARIIARVKDLKINSTLFVRTLPSYFVAASLMAPGFKIHDEFEV